MYKIAIFYGTTGSKDVVQMQSSTCRARVDWCQTRVDSCWIMLIRVALYWYSCIIIDLILIKKVYSVAIINKEIKGIWTKNQFLDAISSWERKFFRLCYLFYFSLIYKIWASVFPCRKVVTDYKTSLYYPLSFLFDSQFTHSKVSTGTLEKQLIKFFEASFH